MFRPREPFESEKLQLQELNQRLGQYLLRSRQLEHENALLITEIDSIRRHRSGEWQDRHMSELREMRRLVERLSFEKCRAEMEREKMRGELQMLQAMSSDEAAVSKSITGQVKGCEMQLHQALQTNISLEDRLIQLENEYRSLEDAHGKEVAHLLDQVSSRASRVVTRTYQAPSVTMEEMQHYADNFAESCRETLDMYRLKVWEIEESIKADQERLLVIQREKKECASQFSRLREEMEKQTQVQLNLEEQLMTMQERFRADVTQYQGIIEELEYERRLLSNTISEKLKDHQDLLQVKMGLALEVAAYRALLEEEGRHSQMWANQHSRERIIDIKMPSNPYTPRVSTTPASLLNTRKQYTGHGVKYMEPISSIRNSAISGQFHSQVPSRVVPISVSNRSQQSPASRRDMISFTKAVQAAAKPSVSSPEMKKKMDVRIKTKEVSQHSSKSSSDHLSPRKENTSSSPVSQITQPKPVKVVSPSISKSKVISEEVEAKRTESKHVAYQIKTMTKEDKQQVKVEESIGEDDKDLKGLQKDVIETDRGEKKHNNQRKESKGKDETEYEDVGPKVFVGKEKVLEAVSMEEIIQQVMRPAGLDSKVISSPDSKMTYHVEKTEQDDGTTKTQIVLQSKVEEELDLDDDFALEELLSKGVKKVTLENIKGTPTGNMIENLLSLGLEGESSDNRTVNVEIIEEPVESDEEGEIEIEETLEIKSKQPNMKPTSVFYQLEELESDIKPLEGKAEIKVEKSSMNVQEVTREESLPYFSHAQESQEYFVSTPEDNMSESEEGGRFMSYTHYGVVDDLSDERYYQEEELKMPTAEGHSYRDSPEYDEHSFVRDSIPECIEEEVHVTPTLQQSIVEILREESLDPEQQLRGALEQIQDTVSGALKEELAFFTKGRETPENVSVDIKKLEQAADNGTMTIVAELNVSQTLEESGLLEEDDDPSEGQIIAALSSSHPNLQQALSAGAGKGFTMKVTQQEIQTEGMPWKTSEEDIRSWSPSDDVSRTEKHITQGPTEKSFTFQMDVNNGSSASASGGVQEGQEQRGTTEFSMTQKIDPHLKGPVCKSHLTPRHLHSTNQLQRFCYLCTQLAKAVLYTEKMASDGARGEQSPPLQTLLTTGHGAIDTKCELNIDNLSKPELLTLLSIMEGELEARDLVIEALRARRKEVFLQERYGQFSLTDPFLALQRDFESGAGTKDRRAVSANPITVLEAVMAHCRKMQERMSAQLSAAESRQKRLEMEKLQLQSLEQEHRKLSAQLKDEREKNKHVVMSLVHECKQLAARVVEENQRFEELSSRTEQDGRSAARLEEELTAERRRSQQMEAEMEKQLAEFDTEREQLRARLSREEIRATELRAESESLRKQVEQLRTEQCKDAPPPPVPPVTSPVPAPTKPKSVASVAVGTEAAVFKSASSQTDPPLENEGARKVPLTIPVKPAGSNYPSMNLPKTSGARGLHHGSSQAENGGEGQTALHGASTTLPIGVSPRVQAARYKFQPSASEQDQNGTANQSPPSRDLSPTNRDNFAAKQQARHTVTQVLSRFTSPPAGGPPAALRPGLPHSTSEGGPFTGRLGHPQIGLKSPTVARIDRGNPPPIPPKKPGLSQTPSPPHPPIKVVGEANRPPGTGLGVGLAKSTPTPQLPPKPSLDLGSTVPALTASQAGVPP